MRSTVLGLVIAVAALAFVAPSDAQAQYVDYGYYYNPGYSYYYNPVYSYYYPPEYAPTYYYDYYEPSSYVWSGGRYVTPFRRGWYYERYYPERNQFYYDYRVLPRFLFRR